MRGFVGDRPRLLIFIVAYHAESTLTNVLSRIPKVLFDKYSCEVLVIDDASTDRTEMIGREYKKEHPEIPITVLRNLYNQGYGGNQKIGYSYAIKNNFDLVALVHGDGQYAPEELPRLLAPFREEQADAVFGSRMMERFSALRGGMPLYKFIGNRILSSLQNLILGSNLSEFHSGYRIYSVNALKRIPFQLNSNNFHFDTEIIIQLLNGSMKIVELPIPTYYGDEICRVNGVKYAYNVMCATIRNWFHRIGLFYRRSYDVLPLANRHYGLKLGYPSSHTYALDAIPDGVAVADIGAGPIGLGPQLTKKNCQVLSIDKYPPELQSDEIEYLVQDLNEPLSVDISKYDYFLLLDIIEHLQSPEDFLRMLRGQFDYRPRKVIVTSPNIAFIPIRLSLLLGFFNYGREGILDMTHTRLFTFATLRRLLLDEGFKILKVRGIPAPFFKAFGDRWFSRILLRFNLALIKVWKELFSYQIYIECESTPSTDYLLRDAEQTAQCEYLTENVHVGDFSGKLAAKKGGTHEFPE